ncbi:MAG TPA: hypothetical protein VK659_25275, partial [Asanoa sp.]|nr:hypothetical protein [Asanoa sp.]
MTAPGRRTTVIAGMLLAWTLVEVVTAAVASAVSGLSLRAFLDGFVVSSAVIGCSLAVAGWPIARHRPGNTVGWLLLNGGILFALSAAGFALLAAATSPGEASPVWRTVATATNAGWPWVIALLLPVTLLVFPDGTLLGRGWRWIVIA